MIPLFVLDVLFGANHLAFILRESLHLARRRNLRGMRDGNVAADRETHKLNQCRLLSIVRHRQLGGGGRSNDKLKCLEYTFDTSARIGQNLVLPKTNDLPICRTQEAEVSLISLSVRTQFGSPKPRKFMLPRWQSPAVPKVAVDEDGHLLSQEHDIRRPPDALVVAMEIGT